MRPAILLPILLLAAATARAEPPSVTAVLTSSDTALGRPVQLEIKVSGTERVTPPQTIQADGLDIRYTGESREIMLRNFQTSSSLTFNYTVMPLKTGSFKIPPQTLRAGNTTLRTPELTLNVVDTPGRAAGRNRAAPNNAPPGDQAKIAFAELIVPKKSAYVGETIPIVVRMGFISQARLDGQEPPNVTGQGFTIQKFGQPERSIENIGGRSYVVYTYKSAISAARPGNLQIGPVEATAALLVPRRPSARRLPFDPFDSDDPFADPFFSDPFGAFLERRAVHIKSDPVALEVKPLPADAPPTFAGGVGNFAMTADANPKRLQVGDPITIKAQISGRGNFDRVSAPMLSEESGWHKYPPSSTFKQDDDVGISGTKTFEMVVSPNEKKDKLPPLVFSYFDPLKEKYVTLRSNPIPLTVEGGAPSPAPAVAAANGPTPAPAPQDILPQISQRGEVVQSFAPLYARGAFWLAQLIPLALVLGYAGWRIRRARASNRAAARQAQLRQETEELLRKLRRDHLAAPEYFADASRVVQLKTALRENIDPAAVDAETAARVFALGAAQREQVQTLFATRDELRYSGSANGAVSPERRRAALDLVEHLT